MLAVSNYVIKQVGHGRSRKIGCRIQWYHLQRWRPKHRDQAHGSNNLADLRVVGGKVDYSRLSGSTLSLGTDHNRYRDTNVDVLREYN
jgi:hypothetical protein